jgi:hypothetical protein
MTQQKTFQVSKEFKEKVTEILQTKKFAAVFPFMNLINREGYLYTENELNSVIQLLSEFPYLEVAEFFSSVKENVFEYNSDSLENSQDE